MSEVDDRIVSIQFDNGSFERKLTETIKSLDKLSESLRFAGAEKGFQSITNAANSFDTSHMANAVDSIAHRFTTLGIIGATTIAHLTLGVLDFAKKIGGDILSPILSGGKSRAVNLEQAKFLFEGIGIDVTKGMESALKAVKGTAFGLDEAAKTAAQFGASGIAAGEKMTSALRGVAGVAALTSRSFSEIGDIFASSAATGVVNNQDLLQFATRGLNAAAALGKVLGKTEAQIHEMASNGELDFKTFADAMDKAFGAHATEANKTYTGSLSNLHAAFSRLGASFITPHLEQQRDLFNALTPVVDSVAEALLPLINDFIVLKRIGINNIIRTLHNLDFDSFKAGISNLAVAGVNLYKAFKPIANVFKQAFREIFSGSIGKTFVSLTKSFRDFTAGIKIGGETLKNIKSVFKGFFATLEIGFTIFKEVLKLIGNIAEALFPASKGFLAVGATTGDFLVNLNKALVAGGGIARFFQTLTQVILHPIDAFKELAQAVSDFFNGLNFASQGPIKLLQDLRDKLFAFFGISSASSATEKALGRIGQRFEQLHNIWDKVQAAFSKVHDFLQPVLDYMVNWFKSLGHKLAEAFHPGDFNALLDVVNVGLLAGIGVLLKKFIDQGLKLDFSGGVFDKIKGALDQLTGTLKSMQTQLKASALEKIAIAIGILTISIIALSLIDSAKLTKALLALSVSFAQLIGAMTLLDKLNFKASIVKLNGIAVAMGLIAAAAVVLSIAIAILSRLKFSELAKGLAGVAVGLGLLIAATRTIKADAPGLILSGIAMIAIATALNIMAGAVKLFSLIKFGDMAKGLFGVSVSLAAVALAMNAMPPSSVLSGAGFIEVAIGLNILAGAVKLFSLIKFGDMVKGLIGIGAALAIIGLAMHLVPLTLPITAAGILILSSALVIMAKAVQLMGKNDIGTLAKGIGAFAATLIILAVAMAAMEGALPGAAALFIIAHGMSVMAKVLIALSGLSFGDIFHGLAGIAAVLALLGLASAALIPVIPEMLALGIALAVIGGAFALFGFGAQQVAKAFEIMAKSGKAGAAAIVDALKILVTALPTIEKAVFDFAINFAKDVLKAAPLLVRLFQAFVLQILETIQDLAPKIAKTVGVLISSFAVLVKQKSPELIQAGFDLLVNFLIGIRDNISEIVTVVSEIMVNFFNALSEHTGEIVEAGANLIITFLEELGNHAAEITTAGADMIIKFILGISNNVNRIVGAVTTLVTSFIKAVATHYTEIAKAGTDALVQFIKGITDNIVKITNAVGDLITRFIGAVSENAQKIIDAGSDAIIKFCNGLKDRGPKTVKAIADAAVALLGSLATQFGLAVPKVADKFAKAVITLLHGIATVIRENAKEMGEAWADVGEAMVDGFAEAFKSAMLKVIEDKIPGPLKGITKKALDIMGIASPSKVFYGIGLNVVKGLELGLVDNFNRPINAIDKGSNLIVDKMQDTLFKISNSVNDEIEFNPTITPVLDLTQVQKAAGDIPSLIDIPKITPGVSFDTARHISSTAKEVGQDVPTPEPSVTNLSFEQNNYSPEALSTNDIYKATKSQFALAKEKLGVS